MRIHAWKGLAFAPCLLVGATIAADAPPATTEEELAEVVITGSNIRGAGPVGQAVVQIDRQVIESTAAVSVQQLLSTAAPQLNGFGSSGQTAGSFEPRLRSLGGSSSASTLVLVDGHRITPGGGIANTTDPNVVPAGAIERIEILADGASSLYGSDAVAGVINIITRKQYDGFEFSGQVGLGDSYKTRLGNLVYGKSWDRGSLIATYGYSYAGNLFAGDRDFVSGNQSNSGAGATGRGGSNFNNFACSPATAVPATGQAGAGLVFAYPYGTGTGIANTSAVNGLCSNVRNADLLPENTAHRLFLGVHQDVGENWRLSGNVIYTSQKSISQVARGTVTNVTVFGPGSTPTGGVGQINPFFVGPTGVNRETVSYSFDDLLGPGATTEIKSDTFIASVMADVEMKAGWQGSFTLTLGNPKFSTVTDGVVCQACALLALNGTAFANASTTTNAQGNNLATNTVVTRLPLTSANALDVWRPAGQNQTSAAVLTQLLDSANYSLEERPVTDLVAKFNGPIFRIPGGEVKVAVGGELYILGRTNTNVTPSPTGPGRTNSSVARAEFESRKVVSAFAETIVPLIGDEMDVPLVRRLDLDLSGRIDRYSDLNSDNRTTRNPKVGFNWTVTDGLLIRGNTGTSFTAPTVGATQYGTGSTITDYFGNGGAAFVIPAGYPNRAALGAACPATGTCTITAGSGVNGIQVFGGNPNLEPQTGRTWAVGFDWRPVSLRGLNVSMTYWSAKYEGIITNLTNLTQAASTPGLENILVLGPSANQIAAATFGRTATTTLPATVSFISNIVQQNMFNVRGKGIDFDIGYNFDTRFGAFQVGVAGEGKFDWTKQTGQAAWSRATNVANTTNTFSPLSLVGRTSLGWKRNDWRTDLFMNYATDYYATDGNPQFAASPCPPNVTTNGLGCQHVPSTVTFDLHVAREFKGDGLLNNLQIYADARNLFDKDPQFLNATNGYIAAGSLNTWGDPIGRVVSVGFRQKW